MFPPEEGFGEPWFPIVNDDEVTLRTLPLRRSGPIRISFHTRIRAWPATFRTAPYDL